MSLGLSTVVAIADDNQVEAEVDGEIVMLSIEQGYYYGLKDTGRRIWDLLREPRRVSVVIDVLVAEYHVDRVTCTREVLSFLDELRQDNLIRVIDDPVR